MNIVRGKTKPKGLRIIVYGVPGSGKTTFASKLQNNLFVDFENGTHGLDVAKIAPKDVPDSYSGMKGILHELKRDHQGFEHITIDTADKCELDLSDTLAREKGVEDIFTVNDYGRTVAVHKRGMASVLDKATDLVNTGFDVIVLAHDTTRKCEPLEKNDGKTYDHTEMRLSKSVAALFTDWADVIIYVGFKTFIVEGDKGTKAHVSGGTRWAYCSYSNDFEAKHRACVDLPDDCSLEKLTKMFPNVIANAVDRVNGENVEAKSEEEVNKAESESETKDPQSKKSDDNKDSAATTKEAKPEETKTVDAPTSDRETVNEFRKTLKQYGMDDAFIVGYHAVEKKFNERYGKVPKDVPINEWPDDFISWVVRGITMEKIKA